MHNVFGEGCVLAFYYLLHTLCLPVYIYGAFGYNEPCLLIPFGPVACRARVTADTLWNPKVPLYSKVRTANEMHTVPAFAESFTMRMNRQNPYVGERS